MQILAVSGSLKSTSTNTLLIHAAETVAPAHVRFVYYNGLADLPHFNPELDTEVPPAAVQNWRKALQNADAILICTPEYAYGMPGSLKNALDWTVSSGDFVGKPVSAMSAAPNAGGGERAHQALVVTLTALSAHIVHEAALIVPLVRTKLDAAGHLTDPSLAHTLTKAVEMLVRAAEQTPHHTEMHDK